MLKKVGFLISLVFIVGLLAACSSGESTVKVDDVITKFKEAGLEAENATEITKDDMGMGPMRFEEGKRILVPSLGEDNGGRLFVFKDKSDLDELKSYYDEMGKSSAMLFSHTHANDHVLIQMNGDMEQAEFDKYAKVIDEL
ncbi:hypothetical protein BK126_02910 [Paenibacillus sp. FSL H7-0326]|uniref:hypothetical protein n=1 Tax=Paenibacillus sp. FSL H7-0326 TaxID=1921144 RepID=UPI00096D535E|nr:hypothetical protein BK126_02910 [Paenibacillus sp. FSL H7-0326]